MTALSLPPDRSLTVKFSDTVEFKLFPWFDEAFSAQARLNYSLRGICKPMQRLFPRYDVPTPDDASARVFAATLDFAGPDGGIPKDVCLKLARGIDEVVRLNHEASIYRKELVKLWGIAVPRMYGFFIGHHEDVPVACLLLELCLGPDAPLPNAEEFIRRAIQNVRKVHTLGITQNVPLELRHFVMKNDKVLLVDLSRAVVHRCDNATLVYNIQRFWLNREGVRKDHRHNCGVLMTIATQSMRAASVPHNR